MKSITFTEVVSMAAQELEMTRPEDCMSFGYDWLDNQLTGLFKGEMLVVGGETGTGKTTFITNIVMRASKKRKCFMFALEDRLVDYGIKALYFELGKILREKGRTIYPWNDFRKNDIKDPSYDEFLTLARERLQNENVLFAVAPDNMTIQLLESTVIEKVNEGVELFMIDHLHYFDFQRGDDTKADYIEKMMIRMRRLQTKTGARIIMVVHYKKLNNQKPTLDSFKDSVSIVQNANYIINLWRDRSEETQGRYNTTFFIPKARNPNGEATIETIFNPNTSDYEFVAKTFGSGLGEPKEVDDFDI